MPTNRWRSLYQRFYKPRIFFGAYVFVIIAFATLYWIAPCATFGDCLTIPKSLYLSVVTITTLGYGDITPKTNFGMLTTSAQAIIGILIIGLFINASWRTVSEKLDQQQAEALERSRKAVNRASLTTYYLHVDSIVKEYKHITFELTTPLAERQKRGSYIENFKFSDLQDFLNSSMMIKHAFESSVIELYYRAEEALVDELKYVLANFEVSEYPELRDLIVAFLNAAHAYRMKDALLVYARRPYNDFLRKQVVDMIKQFDDLPPKEYHVSNVITPVIVLYQAIKHKMELVHNLERKFADLRVKP